MCSLELPVSRFYWLGYFKKNVVIRLILHIVMLVIVKEFILIRKVVKNINHIQIREIRVI
jgi:hypothetical protein